MKRDKRFARAAVAVMFAFGASFIGVSIFYNEAHESLGLDRATFQALALTLLIATLLAGLVVTWFWAAAQDEVVRTADRLSLYWGWTIGAFIWILTPWLTSLPDWLVEPASNPDGDTLFTLSEAAGAYTAGGVVLILIVGACASVIKVGWWLAKR